NENTPPAAPETPPATPAPTGQQPPAPAPAEEGKGGKDAVLADLAKERDKRQSLERELQEAKSSQQAQLDAIAKALGLKPEAEPVDPAVLTQQLTDAQRETAESKARLARYEAAIAQQVPSHLVEFITGSTAEEIEASITKVVAAFNASKPTGPRPDPSQGIQGAPTSLDEQIAAAEQAGDIKTAVRLKARKAVATQ
ncbi:MAG TPA: hypothetical protein VFH66_06595, partial [Mycobacteriales bacterium]|nr:hypothetical protein [Mycobacteriales bacterium]